MYIHLHTGYGVRHLLAKLPMEREGKGGGGGEGGDREGGRKGNEAYCT